MLRFSALAALAVLLLAPAPGRAQAIIFGPPQGNGCQPAPGDVILGGNAGNGVAISGGVAATAVNATYQDQNNDGQIHVNCFAEIDFTTGLAAQLIASLQVAGDWNSPFNIDVNANFGLAVTPGPAVQIFDVNNFVNSTGGNFGAGAQGIFATGSTNNTLQVTGSVDMAGPPGFDAHMNFPVSIDGTVVAAAAVPGLGDGPALLLAAAMVASASLALRRSAARV